MSSKIRLLDEQTINQIAAGEVIENPASVVKELVENSIDAGATEITIEIQGGGRQLIRITDDGCGMNHDDALLCLERHATSKIREIDDIHDLHSMGFRGEAIPSIASISKFTLITRPHEQEVGTMVIVDGGQIKKRTSAACSPGTTMEVKSLFFNVPVRKKFQRSPTYDANEIQKVIAVLALAHPEIKFKLVNQQKVAMQANAKELDERIAEVLGKDYAATLTPVEAELGEIKLRGFIGKPGFSRNNRTGQYLFVNNRAVFSLMLSFTVKDAYGTALAPNRHPVFVLFLDVPGSLVDPNVHPQKREVRLRQEEQLKQVITEAVQSIIYQSPAAIVEEKEDPYLSYYGRPTPAFKMEVRESPEPIPQMKIEPVAVIEEEPEELVPIVETPKVLTTIRGYLVLESDEGLTLMDQRAAHSRVMFEKLMQQMDSEKQIQPLLIPVTLEYSTLEATIIREFLSELQQMGMEVEEFGSNSFIVRALPACFTELDPREILSEIIEEMRDYKDVTRIEKEVQRRVALAATKAAVSRGKKLSTFEGQALVDQLMQCENCEISPWGKAIRVTLEPEQLAKQFQ